MSVLKHIGKHNDKRIVLVYRKIPGDDHMCLVIFSDTLPQMVHDEVMKVLESPVGQNSGELADALFRSVMANGANCLEYLHKAGHLKKVATNQVIITPNAKSSVRLDELNTILDQMSQGEEALKRLAELDANAGMSNKRPEPREVGRNPASRTQPATPSTVPLTDVLTDDQLASQRVAQATRMKLEAQSLLAEAARLEKEAAEFVPTPVTGVKQNGQKRTKKVKTQTDQA